MLSTLRKYFSKPSSCGYVGKRAFSAEILFHQRSDDIISTAAHSMRASSIGIFLGLGVGLFVVATFVFDVVARISVGREGFVHAASEHLHYAIVQPVGSFLLLLPFLLLSGLATGIASVKGFDRGMGIFLLGGLCMLFLYFNGYQGSQVAMIDGKWTAAALSVGLLPFMTIPVLLVCLILGIFVRRKSVLAPDDPKP